MVCFSAFTLSDNKALERRESWSKLFQDFFCFICLLYLSKQFVIDSVKKHNMEEVI